MVHMFLNGDAMKGGRLHDRLLGAPLVAETRSAAVYRFYAVHKVVPAMDPVPRDGRAVTGEVYDVGLDVLRDHLLPNEPDELELGIVELADGTSALAMVLRREWRGRPELTDISELGSWRAYLRGDA